MYRVTYRLGNTMHRKQSKTAARLLLKLKQLRAEGALDFTFQAPDNTRVALVDLRSVAADEQLAEVIDNARPQ